MNLPKVLDDLVAAQNNFDSAAYANCFSETAVVFDEGKTHKGRKEIEHWIADANERYKAVMKPVGFEEKVSQSLLKDAEKTLKSLEAKSGADFNKAYVTNEVAYHKAVINAVETLLIPESENAELKQLLQNILPALKAHLGHAEMLHKEMSK